MSDANSGNHLNEYYSLRNNNHESTNSTATTSSNSNNSLNASPSLSSTTFTELQPAAIYTQLPPIDTLSGNSNNKLIIAPYNEYSYMLYNNDAWKIQDKD